MTNNKHFQGLYKPVNPKKYKGNSKDIVYRSSWEFTLMRRLDSDPEVLWWSSEEMSIKYRSPVDGKYHRYFPDFIVNKKIHGKEQIVMIEIKPFNQTQPPKKKKKITRSYLHEVMTFGVNTAKWEAAEEFCKSKGWQFIKMTEYELGLKKKNA